MFKPLISQQWRLESSDYKKYLYEKYKVSFSKKKLCFYFRQQEYQLDALMVRLDCVEQEKIKLDYCVTAMFIVLIIAAYWGVSVVDAYLSVAQ